MIRLTSCFIILTAFLGFTFSQTVPSAAYQELEYRMIGPFRAGRTVGAVGIPTQPNVFFIGVNNGGITGAPGDLFLIKHLQGRWEISPYRLSNQRSSMWAQEKAFIVLI